ncbi:MAG TPA: glycosyltransferase family 39 protein [Verrucomicrobiae bacterium]
MSALQSIDTAAFRFVNETLANPFFDDLMPIVSGGPWFLPLLLILGTALIWKGGTRARILVLMLAIVLPLGDGWITKKIKYAVERPRPCRVVETVRLPMRLENPREDDENEFHRGCAESGSMPSGHTTNWFAATMVAWIFYRRTLRFMLPLACLVAFSRVYNGVHYPGDVLAGAIIGAGYGAAIAVAVDALWRFVARRWFPLWWNALPSLLPAPLSPTPVALAENERIKANDHWLRLGYVIIAAMFAGRLIYIASGRIELSEDEAYQWLWSKHLALSYYSKPPLIAYVQWLGTHLFGDTELGVRFFSPVCAAIGSLVALRFFAKQVSARAGFWLVAIFNVTPLLAIGSTLMTVDPLLVLFWTLAMFAGWRAVQSDGTAQHWVLVGLWMGFAFLSKYTALLQWLCWAVFFVFSKPARIHLRRPGPYIALAINVLCALPVVIWNTQHDWVTISHVASNAKLDEGWRFRIGAPLEFLGGTFGLLHPIFFAASIWAAVTMWKRYPRDSLLRFFFAMGTPLFLVYALYTLHSAVLLNWIAASVIPLFCLMVAFWEKRFREGARHIRAMLAIALFFGAFAVVLLHETNLAKKIAGHYLPAHADPLRRVRGWTEMAQLARAERAKLEGEGKPVFVIAGHYGSAGLLSFYMPEARTNLSSTPLVYYRTAPRPNNQFYFWPGYAGVRRGQNAIYVQEKERPAPPPRVVVQQFASVTEMGSFTIQSRGRVFHRVQLFACRDLKE